MRTEKVRSVVAYLRWLDIAPVSILRVRQHSLDLERAIEKANQSGVAVYAFYAPSVGLTSRNRIAASYGQNSLNRLANDTAARRFFREPMACHFDSILEICDERSTNGMPAPSKDRAQ